MLIQANFVIIMEFDANVKYGKGSACFRVRKENPGIYYADLVYFDGDKKKTPPKTITLVRGIRQWTGSCEDPELLNELGKIIEELYHLPLTSKSKFK